MDVLRGFLTHMKTACATVDRNYFLLAGLLFFIPISVFSQGQVYWQTNGIVVCDSFYDGGTNSIAITNDGYGNSIIMWADNRGPNESIYAQKVDINGNCLWFRNGLCVVFLTVFPDDFHCISDGRRGAIVSWADRYVKAQRVDSLGIRRWGSDGMRVSVSDSAQYYPAIVEDGSGGAIIAFYERIGLQRYKLIMQRIDRNGNLRWGNGRLICDQTGYKHYPCLQKDNQCGAFIVWADSNGSTLYDLYAQQVDSNGVFKWGPTGKPVYIGSANQFAAEKNIVRDGINGFIVNWYDNRNGNWDVYCQRIDSSGSRKWDSSGVPVCSSVGMQTWTRSINDGNQEVLSIWSDCRSGGYIDLYAQNMDSSGIVHWPENGVWVARPAPDSNQSIMEVKPKLADDKRGGFIVAYKYWSPFLDWDIYAQRVDSSGDFCWGVGGLPVCTTPVNSVWGPVITEDGLGGAVIAWGEIRVSGVVSVYAQRVGDRTGIEEDAERLTPHAGRSLRVNPNPFSVKTVINYTLSTKHQKDKKLATVCIYNACGRLVKSLPLATRYSLLPTSIVWDGSDNSGRPLPAGVYFVELRAGENRDKETNLVKKIIKLR